MQTSRELVDGLLRKTSFDRVGLNESFWADTMALWVRQGYPTRTVYREVGETHNRLEDGMEEEVEAAGEYEEAVPAWEYFGFDMVGMGGWFDTKPLVEVDELIEETDAWEIRRDGAGAAFKYWKHKMGTPEHIDFRMTSRAIWERDYRPHLLGWNPDRLDMRMALKNYAEATASPQPVWRFYGHMFVWEIMRQSMGDVVLYENLLLDPEWIHDFNRVYTDLYKLYFRALIEQVGRPEGIWLYEDMGYNAGLFASPKTFEKLIFPYYREMVEFFHGFDLPVVLHSCGSVAQALPLIVDVGFDALNPMERKAKNNDPYAFARQYGDRLAFIGGLDVRVLETNDRDVVRREVGNYIDGMKATGARLVFGSDHSIPPTIQYDTYRYALDVYREHMWY